MRTEFELPDVGEGVAEGELVTWHVEPGEMVAEDQVLAEVETDKALVEIPSPYDGEIAALRAEEGETVPVGDAFVVFEIDDASAGSAARDGETETDDAPGSETADSTDDTIDGEASSDAASADGTVDPDGRVFAPPSVRRLARELEVDVASLQGTVGGRVTERDVREAARGASTDSTASAAASEASDLESAPDAGTDTGASDGGVDSLTLETDPTATATAASHSAAAERAGGADGSVERPGAADRDRTLAMPATRRLAREAGVDLDTVPASQRRDGEPFVTPADVRAYAANGRSTVESAESAELPAGDGPRTTDEAADGDSSATAADANASVDSDPGPGDRVPYTGVRRTIGERMATSKYTAPHVSHHDEVEVSDLVDARTRLEERAADRGVKLTYLPFAVKAAVAALKEVPELNAELDEENEEIVLRDEYNVGIAVASDAGLMVPVIDDADRKGLLEIAREINDKAERARNRTIGLEEMRGGTFTITNVGAVGGEYASPIINYPEAGILALGSMKERPWVDDGEVVARPTMPISMSVDHRIVDGAEAARFTNEVKRYLHDPELLLLE